MSAWEREIGELPVPNLPPFGRKAGRGLFVYSRACFDNIPGGVAVGAGDARRARDKNRPVGGPGLQGCGFLAISCRPRALTRRLQGILKRDLSAR